MLDGYYIGLPEVSNKGERWPHLDQTFFNLKKNALQHFWAGAPFWLIIRNTGILQGLRLGGGCPEVPGLARRSFWGSVDELQ